MRKLSIYKYILPNIGAPINLEMPVGARVVHFARQISVLSGAKVSLCIWAQVDRTQKLEYRHFVIVGTGHAIAEDLVYVATAQDGPCIWHLHEYLAHG